jgi:MFS family permease
LNALAFHMAAVALTVVIYRHTGSATGAAVFFISAEFLPALAAPLVVALLDRVPAHRALPALYALEGLVSLALAWSITHFNLGMVLLLAFVDGAIAATAASLVYAVGVAVTSPQGLLREGNALLNTAFSVCFMVGPAIAGAIVASGGASIPLLINAGLFAGVVVTLIGIRRLPPPKSETSQEPRLLRKALVYAARLRVVRRLLVLQTFSLVFFTVSLPVEIVLTVRSLHSGAGGYGALIAAWGAGALAGSGFYARFRGRSTRALLSAGAVALAGGFIVMAAAPVLVVAVIGSAIAGVGNGVYSVAVRTALQEEVSERFMALVMSLNEAINRIAPGAGILIGGACTALFGPRPAFGVAGGGSLVVALATWVLLAPSVGPADPEPDDLRVEAAELR